MKLKLDSSLILVGSISLILVLLIAAGWLLYIRQIKQIKTKSGLTVVLKDSQNYPRVETFRVPILMYHYIRIADPDDTAGQKLSVSPQNFAAQMQWLKDNDFMTVALSDLADTDREALSKINGEGYKPIVITFDDGYTDAYEFAFPVLKQMGFTADFFIIMDYAGRAGYMNWDQINSLRKSGMEIGSHTKTHPVLTDLDSARAMEEIAGSKDDTHVFCYPSGRYNDRIKDLVKVAGYAAAVTTKPGVATEKTKLFDLPRVRVNNISVEDFAELIENSVEENE